MYATNSTTHELAVAEPVSQGVVRYLLADEPAAITASEWSGTVYVLSNKPNAILRIDPTDGTELGRVNLPEIAGRFGASPTPSPDARVLRPRLVLDRADESLVVSLPDAGSLSLVPTQQFPPLDHEVPFVQAPQPEPVADIPNVIRATAPSQP